MVFDPADVEKIPALSRVTRMTPSSTVIRMPNIKAMRREDAEERTCFVVVGARERQR